jgi:hypothetical protein
LFKTFAKSVTVQPALTALVATAFGEAATKFQSDPTRWLFMGAVTGLTMGILHTGSEIRKLGKGEPLE